MTLTPTSQHAAAASDTGRDGPGVQRADRWLLIGSIVCSTVLFGPIGLALICFGLVVLRRVRRSGEFVRPTAVTVFGLFALVDAAFNFVGWSIDLFMHDTHLAQVAMMGWGRMFDGAYYLHYNSTAIGGSAAAGEKSWQMFCILGIFPARIAASWAFLKLRRWGFRWMIWTSWAYIILWLGYVTNMLMYFPDRMGAALYGATGWWVFDIWYMTPFLTLPWLYALDKRRWNR